MPSDQLSVGVPAEQGATIVAALYENARRWPDRPAMRLLPAGRVREAGWKVVTWSEYLSAARQIAAGLAGLGVSAGDRVGILSSNRVEWHLADLGALLNGSVTVPVYPTSSSAQVAHILAHAQATVCFVDTHTQLGRLVEAREKLPELKRVVLIEGSRRASDTFVVGFDALRSAGASQLSSDPGRVDERAGQVQPDDLATIVYTSGTSGTPKGAMLTHDNVMWTLRRVTPLYGVGSGERLLSFLPLSHIAERMMSELLPIALGAETWFARSISTVGDDLPACRPTVFLAVPRIWEKLREAAESQLRAQPAPLRLALERYVRLGLAKVASEQDALPLPPALRRLWEVMDLTIGRTMRQRLGLDAAKVLFTAAAPARPELIRWFHAIGLPLLQLYGQTEGCGPTSANQPGHLRIGTVGAALPGMQIRVAPDGEILLKGRNVCLGYLADPEATAELIDREGWMHTGDTGEFDAEGSLRLLGRKKDIIITAAGKNISPEAIESDLANHPLIAEAVVAGEGRRYLVALITLDPEALVSWAKENHRIGDVESLSSDPDLRAEIQAAVDQVNAERSHVESIRKFRVLAHPLTTEEGELTPTMKVRRAVVYEHHADVIAELYAQS